MIKTIKKGGVFAISLSVVLVAVVIFVPITAYFHVGLEKLPIQSQWAKYLIPFLCIIIQSVWFYRVIHNSRFFEQSSLLPWIIVLALLVSSPEQLMNWNTIMVNFIWLIFYQKLFYLQDQMLSHAQIFMETGILICVAFIFYPKAIYLLPLLFVMLNQFAASDLNRFFLVIVSFLMVAISVLSIGYFYFSSDWIVAIPENLKLSVDINSLTQPRFLYPVIVWLSTLVLLIPVVYNQLSFMQTKNRTIINMLYLQILCVLGITIFSGKSVSASMAMAALPLAFIISWGVYHIKNRWLANVLVLLTVFALVLIQWTYMRGMSV